MNLKNKLTLIFLMVALIPALTISFIATYISTSSLEQQGFAQLISVRDIKKSQITSYFGERKGDIEVLAMNVVKLLDKPNQTFSDVAHSYQDYFARFIEAYGYYDFF